MSSQSKRKSPRAGIEIKVEYQNAGTFVSEFSRDISRGGLFIRTGLPLPVGEKLLLTLTFPGRRETVNLKAMVRRVVSMNDSGEPGMGLSYVFSDEDERAAFFRLIDHMLIEQLSIQLYERLSDAVVSESTAGMRTLESSLNIHTDSFNTED
jgi:type IV pilus assembly protein PilZ